MTTSTGNFEGFFDFPFFSCCVIFIHFMYCYTSRVRDGCTACLRHTNYEGVVMRAVSWSAAALCLV